MKKKKDSAIWFKTPYERKKVSKIESGTYFFYLFDFWSKTNSSQIIGTCGTNRSVEEIIHLKTTNNETIYTFSSHTHSVAVYNKIVT